MRKKHILAIALSSILLLQSTGCSLPIGKAAKTYTFTDSTLQINRKTREKTKPMGKKGTWTIFVYLCGSNLESKGGMASADMEEMIASSANDDVKFVVETGGAKSWKNDVSADKNQRYVIQNGEATLVEETDYSNMSDSDTLTDFLSWGIDNYAAANMGLVFWNHGGGSVYGVCNDEKYDNDMLSLREIDAALYNVYDEMTEPFEFIGYDACLMATVENAALMATHANYMIASEETESGYGWDYTAIGDYLAENPKANGEELGKEICDSFYQSCADNGKEEGATLSVVDLTKMDSVLNGFDAYTKTLVDSMTTENYKPILQSIYLTDRYGYDRASNTCYNLIDLEGFLSCDAEGFSQSEDLQNALNDAVVYKVNGSDHANASGLSVYYPLQWNSAAELEMFTDLCVSENYLAFIYQLLKCFDADMADNNVNNYYHNDWSAGNYSSDNGVYHYSQPDYYADLWQGADDLTFGESDAIQFASEPTLNSNGNYSFTLDADSIANTEHVEAMVYTWDEENNQLFELGYSGEIDNSTSGTYSDQFDGYWFALPDGQFLNTNLVKQCDGYTIYSAAVKVNGEATNLRFKFDTTTKNITILGIWDGSSESGSAARMADLESGDTIQPIYQSSSKYTDEISTTYGEEYTYTGTTLQYKKLDEGDYWYAYVIYDIYGNYTTTSPTIFHVKDDAVSFEDQQHIWTEATCTEPKTCLICGETEGEALGHKWSKATCTKPKTCKVCGATEGKKAGHKWEDATCTEPQTCSVCGKTKGGTLDHDWKDATCTEPKTCKRCGATEGDALGHDSDSVDIYDTVYCDILPTCDRCGETIGYFETVNYTAEAEACEWASDEGYYLRLDGARCPVSSKFVTVTVIKVYHGENYCLHKVIAPDDEGYSCEGWIGDNGLS